MLIGRVGKDPEVRRMESGNTVANFSLATSEKRKNKQGEYVEQTEWHNIVAWNKLAEIIEKYVKKGDLIYIWGSIAYRSWEDKEGVKKYRTDILASELKMLGSKNTEAGQRTQEDQVKDKITDAEPSQDDDADDLPF